MDDLMASNHDLEDIPVVDTVFGHVTMIGKV